MCFFLVAQEVRLFAMGGSYFFIASFREKSKPGIGTKMKDGNRERGDEAELVDQELKRTPWLWWKSEKASYHKRTQARDPMQPSRVLTAGASSGAKASGMQIVSHGYRN